MKDKDKINRRDTSERNKTIQKLDKAPKKMERHHIY